MLTVDERDQLVRWSRRAKSAQSLALRSQIVLSDLRGDERAVVSDAHRTVFAVGTTGRDVSLDRGKTWEQFDDGPFISIDCAQGSLACWAAGPEGRVAGLVIE